MTLNENSISKCVNYCNTAYTVSTYISVRVSNLLTHLMFGSLQDVTK